MAVAVLDVGKTNVKVVLFEAGQAAWQRSMPNGVLPGPPFPHLDVEAIWRFFLDALIEAARHHAIADIVVTTHGATATLVDEAGLVLPVMDYEFAGVDVIEPDYAPLRPPFAETLSPPLGAGLTFGRALYFQQRRHPAAFAKAQHILMYPQYFCWRLTGVAVGEATSLGCHGDIWRPAEGRASSLVDRLGWGALLPRVAKAYDVVGPLRPDIQAETGLGTDVRVRAGIHDSNASILPHLLTIEPPFTVISTGTWVVIMAIGGSTATLDPARDMIGYADVEGRAVPAGKYMGGREYRAILGDAAPEADANDLLAVLAAGAMALPSFVPEGGPFPGKAGRVVGTLPDRPGARAALAALYEALMTDLVLANLGATRGPLIVEGSFAANALYCGALAALRPEQSVLAGSDTAGTAYGASLLATWPSPPGGHELQRILPLPAVADRLLEVRRAWMAAASA